MRTFNTVVLVVAGSWSQPLCPSLGEQISKMLWMNISEHYVIHQKQGTRYTYSNVDRSLKYRTDWQKEKAGYSTVPFT